MNLKSLDKRVRVLLSGVKGAYVEGVLHELMGTKAVLPQYFVVLDNGTVRDLRNDNYYVVEDEE